MAGQHTRVAEFHGALPQIVTRAGGTVTTDGELTLIID